MNDLDPQETLEWIEAMEAVIERDGFERAQFLLRRLADRAVTSGVDAPYMAYTPYLNTIPPELEVRSSGNQELESKIRSIIRWNAAMMVMRANRDSSELGGHIASFASSALLYDIGFNHFWQAPRTRSWWRPGLHPGTFGSRDLCQGFSRRSDHRRTDESLPSGIHWKRSFILSPPLADAGILAVSNGLDGFGSDHGNLPGSLSKIPSQP